MNDVRRAVRNLWHTAQDKWSALTPLGREMVKAAFYLTIGVAIGAVVEAG